MKIPSPWFTWLGRGMLLVQLPVSYRFHARPAALIASVVLHHRASVELEVAGRKCPGSSILAVLATVGGVDDPRQLVFRGDERALRDLRELFAHHLGERGLEELPPALAYLRSSGAAPLTPPLETPP